MKQDKWIEQLHDKLAEHETAAPDGLWDDIESALGGQSRRARIVAMRRWMVAAAAVALILGLGGMAWLWQNEMQQESLISMAEEQESLISMAEEQESLISMTEEQEPLVSMAEKQEPLICMAKEQERPRVDEPCLEMEKEATAHTVEERVAVEQTVEERDLARSSEVEAYTDAAIQHPTPNTYHPSPNTYHPSPNTQHPTFALYAMNTFGTRDNSNAVMMADALARTYTDTYTTGSQMAGSKVTDNEVAGSRQMPIYLTDYEEHQHHKQPVGFGLSVAYPLNSRLSLMSGIVYTRLESEFTQTIHSQHIQQEQVLHYVGIPLSLSCRLWEYGRFKTYLAAGVQADWNVSAHLNTEGVEQTMRRDRMQWSANGSLGLQYDVLPQLSFYAEPGINYHFDNGSSVQNFFKDKPTNLRLQVGVRLRFAPEKK